MIQISEFSPKYLVHSIWNRDQKAGFVEVDSEKMLYHKQYFPDPDIDYDIALIKLKRGISDFGKLKLEMRVSFF